MHGLDLQASQIHDRGCLCASTFTPCTYEWEGEVEMGLLALGRQRTPRAVAGVRGRAFGPHICTGGPAQCRGPGYSTEGRSHGRPAKLACPQFAERVGERGWRGALPPSCPVPIFYQSRTFRSQAMQSLALSGLQNTTAWPVPQ